MFLPDVNGKPVINAFQWAKARLTAECPLALSEVQRFEADSKFFRSFVVVLFLPRPLGLASSPLLSDGRTPAEPRLVLVSICVVLGFLSLWCYVDRRFKATQHAYWFLLTLERLPRAQQGKSG